MEAAAALTTTTGAQYSCCFGLAHGGFRGGEVVGAAAAGAAAAGERVPQPRAAGPRLAGRHRRRLLPHPNQCSDAVLLLRVQLGGA
ncbi:Os05g0128100 [Oryza sativa Japonica Group]|uniref:Os05g0128100 protein n=1 Tax=Oryza sativa subsp. japonica TaxID=39947 RepID=A0A0P0WHH0_ORYSJ|nr:Os05g0128100 [Oryza sativa Japonica Group]